MRRIPPRRFKLAVAEQYAEPLLVWLRATPGVDKVYAAGSLRRIAQACGLEINEYGVFLGGERIAGETEESVYAAIGLAWVTPELREDRGEVEAARTNRLPVLIERGDLCGDLHARTKATDGHDSLREMALAAHGAGWKRATCSIHDRSQNCGHCSRARSVSRNRPDTGPGRGTPQFAIR